MRYLLLAVPLLILGAALIRPSRAGEIIDDRLSSLVARLNNHEQRLGKLEGRGG